MNFIVGARVVIGPAYDMETRDRTRVDEFTGVEGTILRFAGDDAIVETPRTEVAINVGRLSSMTAAWRAATAMLANDTAARSRSAGAPHLTAESPRETVIAWLQWCDPNGCHTDDLSLKEWDDVYTTETAWEALAAMLDSNA